MALLQFLGVGLVAGWVMGKIRKGKGKGYGLIKSLLVGVIGSFIGWFLMGFMKVESPNLFTQLAMAVMGATVFSLVVTLLTGKKKKIPDEDEE